MDDSLLLLHCNLFYCNLFFAICFFAICFFFAKRFLFCNVVLYCNLVYVLNVASCQYCNVVQSKPDTFLLSALRILKRKRYILVENMFGLFAISTEKKLGWTFLKRIAKLYNNCGNACCGNVIWRGRALIATADIFGKGTNTYWGSSDKILLLVRICNNLSPFPKNLSQNQKNNWTNMHVLSKKRQICLNSPWRCKLQLAVHWRERIEAESGLFSSPTELGRLPTHRPTSSNPKNTGSIPSKKQPHCNALKWGFEGESVSYARSRRSKYSLSSDVSPMQTHSAVKISLTQT